MTTGTRQAVPEALPEPSGPGTVVLDIGGHMGALVLYTPPELEGEEIEIRPAGMAWDGTHVAVRERRLPGGPCWAAVFGPLRQGTYDTRTKGEPGSPVTRAEVTGGAVATAHWKPA